LFYYTQHILICTNQKPVGKKCCADSGGQEYFEYIKNKLLEKGMHGPKKIRVSKTGCLGRCGSGPLLAIYPEGVWYSYATFEDIDEIIDSYLIMGNPVLRLLIDEQTE
jgi:(2Fe-2S) ferredoxin